MFDKQLFRYLEQFRIIQFDQMETFKVKCRLCIRKKHCCTVTFTSIISGNTLALSLCQDCSDKVRQMHAILKSKEDIDAQTPVH